MALVTNNISGSASNSSKIGITGSVIIGNAPDGRFPTMGADTVFFISGSDASRTVFGGTAVVSGSLITDGNVTLGNASNDTLMVAGTSNFQMPATFTGATAHNGGITGTTLALSSNATVLGTLAATGNITGTGTSNQLNALAVTGSSGLAITNGATVGTTLTVTGDLAVNGGDITTSASTFNLLNESTTLNIGSTAVTRTTNIATGAAAQTVTLGSTSGASTLTLQAGTGTIGIGTSAAIRTTNIATGAAVQTINIGTGAAANVISIGSTTGASSLALKAGTGDINIATSATTLVGIGTASPSYKLDVQTDIVSSWAANFFNDGNATSRYGIRIQSGTDAANGDLIDFYDGNGDLQGTISFNAGTVTYGSFTGDHYAQILDSSTNKIYGTIVKIVQATTVSNRKNVDYIVEKTTFMKDPAVLGVFASSFEAHTNKSSLENLHSIFSLGDGHILVTDQGGNISIGDYICSSDYPGHGMKQDDNILRSYTVAKSTQAIDFSTLEVDPVNGVKSILISCTYHCG